MAMHLSPAVIRALEKERLEIERRRAELQKALAALDAEFTEISDALEPDRAQTTDRQELDGLEAEGAAKRRAANRAAVNACRLMLSTGPKSRDDLINGVQTSGINLMAEDPARRLVQLLSQHEDFQYDRKMALWSLKGESPAGATATNSDGGAFSLQPSPARGFN